MVEQDGDSEHRTEVATPDVPARALGIRGPGPNQVQQEPDPAVMRRAQPRAMRSERSAVREPALPTPRRELTRVQPRGLIQCDDKHHLAHLRAVRHAAAIGLDQERRRLTLNHETLTLLVQNLEDRDGFDSVVWSRGGGERLGDVLTGGDDAAGAALPCHPLQ